MNVRQLATRIEPGRPPDRQAPTARREAPNGSSSFVDVLDRAQARTEEVKLSAHARQRIDQRRISLNPDEQHALSSAMHQLDAKGARDAVLLRADAAFVVSVPNRTVVTAMDRAEMHERAFTKIDSAMLI